MADIDTSVLIVGAGPAGLVSSNLLSRHGMHHLLVDCYPASPIIVGQLGGVADMESAAAGKASISGRYSSPIPACGGE
jgi:thioredoxin reductase